MMRVKNYQDSITWEMILFFALYLIMPEYFALEFSASLPLITVSRVVYILFGIGIVIRRRSELFSFGNTQGNKLSLLLTNDPVFQWGLIVYFVLLLVANLAHILDIPSESVKAVFVLVAEQYLLVWIFVLTIDTKKKLLQCLKLIVYASGVVGVIATISVVWDNNLFYYLNTVTREMLMTNYYRLGVLRAEAGFGHPVYYGAFCAIILPMNMYFVEESEKRYDRVLFSCCMVSNLIGLVLSNSRGSLLAFLCIIILMIPIKSAMKIAGKVVLRYLGITVATICALIMLANFMPRGTDYLTDIMGSVLEVILPEKVPGEENPEESTEEGSTEEDTTEEDTTEEDTTKEEVEYGENPNGVWSRMVQLSGIEWTLKRSPMFGFGSNAHVRKQVAYEFYEGFWSAVATFDMGIVAIIGQYGIVGLVGYISLYGCVLITLIRKKMWKDRLMMSFFYVFASIFLCLLSISSLDQTMWVMIGLFACYVNMAKGDAPEVDTYKD